MEIKLSKKVCPFCYKEFSSFQVIRQHSWKEHHFQLQPKGTTKNIKCNDILPFTTSNAEQYPDAPFIYSCPSCLIISNTKEEYSSHVNDNHILSDGNTSQTNDDQNENINENIPSDLSIDHHPNRQREYELRYHTETTQIQRRHTLRGEDSEESKWIINGNCISDKCILLKENTKLNPKDPASLSDLRLLVLNDIYMFDKNIACSVSKYFGNQLHQFILSDLHFDEHIEKGGNSLRWCLDISQSSPSDWVSSLSLTANLITKATLSGNIFDIHIAQILSQLLPLFTNGSPDSTIEDSFVHHYLAPMFMSVFSSNPLLKTQWANGAVKSNEAKIDKPDFLVYTKSVQFKCAIVVAEVKPPNTVSSKESDLVKLARQLRFIYNDLVLNGIPKPKVCGILCEGYKISTFMLDLISPHLYRLIKLSQLTLFHNIDEISSLPNLLSRLLQVKNIALETAVECDTSLVAAAEKLQRNHPNPPSSWLTFDTYALSRKRKIPFTEESV